MLLVTLAGVDVLRSDLPLKQQRPTAPWVQGLPVSDSQL